MALPALMLTFARPLGLPWLSLGLVFGFFGYLTVSTTWADPSVAERYKAVEFFIRLILAYALLFVGLRQLCHWRPNWLEPWLNVMAVVGGLSALVGVGHYTWTNWALLSAGELPRFKGLAWGGDTNRVAMFYLFGMFASIAVSMRGLSRYRWVYWLLLLPPLACILLAQTKIALAILIIVVIGLAARSVFSGNKLLLLTALVGAVSLVAWLIFGQNTFARVYSLSIRWDLWTVAVTEVGDQWLWGNGLNYRVNIAADGKVFGQAHNFIVDSYRFGGLIAVTLLLAQIIYTFWLSGRVYYSQQVRMFLQVWFGAGVLAALVYSQQPFTRPSYTWIFYWLPMALIMIGAHRPKIEAQS